VFLGGLGQPDGQRDHPELDHAVPDALMTPAAARRGASRGASPHVPKIEHVL
jgi:hypothetical protein